jgi:single-stranded-DNA-specific exonuclease
VHPVAEPHPSNSPSYRSLPAPSGSSLRTPPAPPALSALPPDRGLKRRWAWRGSGYAAASNPSEGLVDRVLRARALEPALAASFLEPKLTDLHDPSAMPGLDRAADRLLAAARAHEPIVIYGDYDADGVTATAILFHTLKHVAPDATVSTYVPHRLEEGYGLNAQALDELARQGARVIVSVDCGITAAEPAAVARRAGVDLIITDHHNLPDRAEDLPDAFALVHPRLPGSTYPFGDLCGAGVAYKLAWRLATRARGAARVDDATRALLIELLALAALGSIADVVPLLGENRILARFGLGRIKHSPIVGLRALVHASGLDGERVDAWGVAFQLAPRLNASGRMGHARESVELFTTTDPARAAEIAERLTAQNNHRRTVEREILDQAVERIERDGLATDDRRAIVLSDPRWHPGVVGIVCSRLVERFGRPAILLCESEGEAAGSGRSIDGFNLHAALAACSTHLSKFGGHDMAAGLRLPASAVSAFADAFIHQANAAIAIDELTPVAEVDARADLAELTVPAVQSLDKLAPFGRGNPAITLRLDNLVLDGPPVPLGKQGQHLALPLRAFGGGRVLRTVAWKWSEHRAALRPGARFDALIRPLISSWSGRHTVEPELIDIRPHPSPA